MTYFGEEHTKLLRNLIQQNVEFILLGGHAAIYYGVRRTTSDIDILVKPSSENGKKVLQAFEKSGLVVEDIVPEDFETQMVLSFGMEPNAVDMMNYIIGLDIQAVFANSLPVEIGDLKLRMIDIRDLITNKEALHREGDKQFTDQQDIYTLRKIAEQKG